MELRKLRYLVKVLDAGGFRRASEQLNIAQPALTRQIQALEAEFGVPLLFRSAAGVSATPQGEIVVREAREILARADGLRNLVSPDHERVAGEVRLGLPSALAEMIFGAIVQHVRTRHPAVHIICREGAAGFIEDVEQGALDLAIVSATSRRSNYRCHFTPLIAEQDYLIRLRDAHSPDQPVSIEELLPMPLILTPLPNARRQHLDRLARGRGVTLNVVTEAASMSAQLNLVLSGLGSAVLPSSAAQAMARDDRVQIVPVSGLRSHRVLLTSVKAAHPIAANAVAKVIQSLFSRKSWDDLMRKGI